MIDDNDNDKYINNLNKDQAQNHDLLRRMKIKAVKLQPHCLS